MILKIQVRSIYDPVAIDYIYYEAKSHIRISHRKLEKEGLVDLVDDSVVDDSLIDVHQIDGVDSKGNSLAYFPNFKIAYYEDPKGNHRATYFNGRGYLLNDEGKTIERL